MHIASRWFGWCGLALGAVGASAALYMTRQSPVRPASESWRELTYRTYAYGYDCHDTPEANAIARKADEEALAECLDAWEGMVAIHPVTRIPGVKEVLVEQGSPLEACLHLSGGHNYKFCGGSWDRPPADATLNVPAHLGITRPRTFDEYSHEREWERAALSSGSIVSLSCPAHVETTFVGLPSRELKQRLSRCDDRHTKGWFRLLFDEAGDVDRVVTTPERLSEVPCIMANACGLRFAGLGAGLSFWNHGAR